MRENQKYDKLNSNAVLIKRKFQNDKMLYLWRPIDVDSERARQQFVNSGLVTVYTCVHCESLQAMTDIRKQAEVQAQGINQVSSQLDAISTIQQEGFEALQNQMDSGFRGVRQDLGQLASITEWGFQDLGWKIAQQSDVLKSIDQTLKTPLETQANELRQMAEQLFARGVLAEAVTRFLKSA